MANVNRNAFVVVRCDGRYLSGFVGVGIGEPVFSSMLCKAEMYSTIGVAERFKNMINEELKVRRVDLNLGDV